MTIGQETKDLASLALRNAFWHEFSALVNAFVAAAEGLHEDNDDFADMLCDLTSVYGVDSDAEAAHNPNLPVVWAHIPGLTAGRRFSKMLDALLHPGADELFVNGTKVFEKDVNGWRYLA